MEEKWVKAFVTATEGFFATMLSIEAKAERPRLKVEPFPTFDVSGLIGFSGLAQGSIAVSFPRKTALSVVSAMIGTNCNDADREVYDAVGEIANIIAGSAKKDLAELKLSISLPQVVVGPGHVLSSLSTIPVTVVPFSTPLGNFVMELCLRKSKEAR